MTIKSSYMEGKVYFWQKRKFYAFYLPVMLSAAGGLVFSVLYNDGYSAVGHALMTLVFGGVSATFLTIRLRRSLFLSLPDREALMPDDVFIGSPDTWFAGDSFEADIDIRLDGEWNITVMSGPSGMKISGGRLVFDIPQDFQPGYVSYKLRVTDVISGNSADVIGGFEVAGKDAGSLSVGGEGLDVRTGVKQDGGFLVRLSALKDTFASIAGGANPEFNSDDFIKKWRGDKDESLFDYITLVRYGKYLTETRFNDRLKLYHNRVKSENIEIAVKPDRKYELESFVSEMMVTDRPLIKTKDLIPVLFVHGYSAGIFGLGGGKHTWGNLPLLFSDDKFTISEFRWRTAQRFQDAVKSLAEAIAILHEATGRKVHIVAHSFGGLLARCYIQSLSAETPFEYDVDGLVTFATPHSGISAEKCLRYGSALPKGQFFSMSATGQVTGYQAGQDVKDMRSNASFGTEEEPGYIPARLCDFKNHRIPDGLDILSIIGLTNKDITDIVEDGDRVISYAGQRFAPLLTLNGIEPLLTDFEGFGGRISETVMGASGADIHPGDRFIFNPDIYGYAHSPLIKNRAPEVFVNCAERSLCRHPAYVLISDYLEKLI